MKKLKYILMAIVCSMVVCMAVPKVEVYAAPKMTLAQLRAKFPHGKYWNHIGSSTNNPDGWTNTPCNHHFDSNGKSQCNINGSCGCNNVGKGWNAIQCMGFAYKLGYDAFGSNPGSSWATVTGNNAKEYVLYNIKPGDVVRFRNDGHSMFVTKVSGKTITYAECNVQGTCIIRWDRTITRTELNKTLTNVKIAPGTFVDNDYNIRFSYNLIEGTGTFPTQSVKYNSDLTIPNNALVRNGYTFGGFAAYRVQDKKYYTLENGWQTQDAINQNKYTKKAYVKGTTYRINSGWTSSPTKQYAFIFAAIWNPVNISVKYDANGGTGTYNKTYVMGNSIVLPSASDMNYTGYKLKGFHFYRAQDKAYSTDNGWQTQESIDKNGYVKKVFDPGSSHTVNTSWTTDFSKQSSYSFVAVWEPSNIEATSITLNKTALTMNKGNTYTLRYAVLPANNTNKYLAWSSSNEKVATVANGIITAVAPGTANITVRTDNNITATCKVTVVAPLTAISLQPEKVELKTGECQLLSVTFYPSDTTTDKTLTWSSSHPSVATVDKNGKVTAVAPGTATITAKTTTSLTATRTITVIERAPFNFTDVSKYKWYYNVVKEAYEKGLMSGTSETIFSPEDNMTRGMIVTVLHRIAGKPIATYSNRFSDVGSKSYCATAVEWAALNKIVSGYSNGKFGPNDNITRQDVAVMLYNYAKSLGLDVKGTSLDKFADRYSVSSYAKPAMEWAVSVGILSGSTDKATGKVYLNPRDNATRAECAKMLLVASKIYK